MSSSRDYLPNNGDLTYSVDQYDLDLTYRPSTNRLDGVATIAATASEEISSLSLDLAGLAVDNVDMPDGRVKKYTLRKNKQKLVITLAEPVAAGETFQIVVTYSGRPEPVAGRWGEVGWEELSEGSLVAGQPNGAPSWFPCNDRPADKAAYRITVTTDSPFTVVANGRLVDRRVRSSTTRWVYEQDEPMATYLATVQIGPYEIRDLPGAAVRQQVALPARIADEVRHDLGRQDEMMACFGELFGPYPFATYTVVVTDDPLEIPLEAQSLSIFGANHLAGQRAHERLVAHELAHQWFGNSLTVASWSDIWLNEGFACYAEWLWAEAAGGATAQTSAEKYWKRLRDQPQDLLLVDPGPELMFDDRLYKRGALALHALRMTVGDDDFFDLLRSWVAKNRFGSVDTAAFVEHATNGARHGVRPMLRSWLEDIALPKLP